MKRIVLASVAALSFAGVAAAQEAPVLQGNYDAAVLNQYNGNNASGVQNGGATVETRAFAIRRDGSQVGGYGPQVREFDVQSGR